MGRTACTIHVVSAGVDLSPPAKVVLIRALDEERLEQSSVGVDPCVSAIPSSITTNLHRKESRRCQRDKVGFVDVNKPLIAGSLGLRGSLERYHSPHRSRHKCSVAFVDPSQTTHDNTFCINVYTVIASRTEPGPPIVFSTCDLLVIGQRCPLCRGCHILGRLFDDPSGVFQSL